MHYLPRDFIATPQGLIFAVVAEGTEQGRVLCFLRYVVSRDGTRKLNTDEANSYLRKYQPDFLFHSESRDAGMHGVPCETVATHFRPRERLHELLGDHGSRTAFEDRVARFVRLLTESDPAPSEIGVTGSVLVRTQNADSDIDLVFYDAQRFHRARAVTSDLTRRGILASLDDCMWRRAYQKRGCSLAFDEFLWHEQRKANKAVFEGTKVDLSLVVPKGETGLDRWRKQGEQTVRTRVLDDRNAFDYPSCLQVEHHAVTEVVSFTATYCGQARVGETIEAAGLLEVSSDGKRRLVVGTSREAAGQYIRVLKL